MCIGLGGGTKKQLAHVSINDASQTKHTFIVYIALAWEKKAEFQFDQCCWSFVRKRKNKHHLFVTFLFQSSMRLLLLLQLLCFFPSSVLIAFFRRPISSVVVIRIGCHFCSILRKQMPPQWHKKVSTKFGLNFAFVYAQVDVNTHEKQKSEHIACRGAASMVQNETKWILLSKWRENIYASRYNQCAIAFFFLSFFFSLRFSNSYVACVYCVVCIHRRYETKSFILIRFYLHTLARLVHHFLSIFLSDIHRPSHNAQFRSLNVFATIFLCVILSYNLLAFVLSFFLSFIRSFVRSPAKNLWENAFFSRQPIMRCHWTLSTSRSTTIANWNVFSPALTRSHKMNG